MLPRRAIAVERTSPYRTWQADTRSDLRAALVLWGRYTNFSVDWVQLGKIPECEQVRIVAQSAVLIGIAGAENVHAAFLPRHGVLVEVDPFCAAGTIVRRGAQSGMTLAEIHALRASRCCKSNFALGGQNCAPLREVSEMETAWRWRGPGLAFRGDLWRRAVQLSASMIAKGRCVVGAADTPAAFLSSQANACNGGAGRRWSPHGRWAELARLRGIVYVSLARCTCEHEPGSDTDCRHLFRHGALRVNVHEDVLPLLFVLYEHHLRTRVL